MNLSDRLEQAKRDRLALRQRERLVLGGLDEAASGEQVDPGQADPPSMRMAPAPHFSLRDGADDEIDLVEPIRLDDYRPVDLSSFDATFNPVNRAADFSLDDWMVRAHEEEQLREARLRGLYDLITSEREQRFTLDLTDDDGEPTVYAAASRQDSEDAFTYRDANDTPVGALPRREPLDIEPLRRVVDPRFEQYARRHAAPLANEPVTAPSPPEEVRMNRYTLRNAAQPAPMARRRGRKHSRRQKDMAPRPTQHLCPQCGSVARIDIHDPFRGRLHLSCNVCFKMWQKEIEPTYTASEDSYLLRD